MIDDTFDRGYGKGVESQQGTIAALQEENQRLEGIELLSQKVVVGRKLIEDLTCVDPVELNDLAVALKKGKS